MNGWCKTQIPYEQTLDGDEITDGYQTLLLSRLFIFILFIAIIKKKIIIRYRVRHAVDPDKFHTDDVVL